MAWPPLATPDDLTRFGYDTTKVTEGDLQRASARIRRYTRQTITQVLGDQVTRHDFRPVRLPQRPVQQVTAVTWLDGTDVEQYTLVGSLLWLRDLSDPPWMWDWWVTWSRLWPVNSCSWPPFPISRVHCQPVTIKVTYDHGYPPGELPDDLIELTCSVASRLAHTPSTAGPLRSLLVGGYQETYSDQTARRQGDLEDGEKKALDAIFPRTRARTLVLPA